MVFTVEAFNHTTELGKPRLCVRFSERPDASLIALLKSAEINARYRKGVKKGDRPLWYIPEASIDTLSAKLGEMTQLQGGQMDKLSRAIAPYATQDPSDGEDEQAESEADDEPCSAISPPPRKRLRTRLPTLASLIPSECICPKPNKSLFVGPCIAIDARKSIGECSSNGGAPKEAVAVRDPFRITYPTKTTSLEVAPDFVKDDPVIVRAMLKKDPLCYQWASDRLKIDRLN